ncbi:hypothetical protein [Streptomyces rhizosphaericus]|uniref:hypothetical protein n=1 Tax=Streptomyces rhizosphaericus TaxID=114699 RepID=UPI00117D1F35|nr:hypothetical protein [Streptomyces rhizosphaericus]
MEILQVIVEERRTRGTFTSLIKLLSSLATAACAGEWHTAQESAGALQQLCGDLTESGRSGPDADLLPSASIEVRLHGALEALGYPAPTVDRLLAALEATTPDALGDMHQEALRAELHAFAHRNDRRDELILESVAAEITEVETARLARIARGTVRAVRSRAAKKTPVPRPGTSPPAQTRLPSPTVPPVFFLAPRQSLPCEGG